MASSPSALHFKLAKGKPIIVNNVEPALPALGAADKLLPLSFSLQYGKAAQENDVFVAGLFQQTCNERVFERVSKILF